MIFQNYDFSWQEFVTWFLSLPLFYQILVGVGIVTIIVLILVGVYYLLKGIGYLIYYIFKGIYYILKGIALLIARFFEGLYYLITGKRKTEPESEEQETKAETPPEVQTPPLVISEENVVPPQPQNNMVSYCSECGVKFTDSMIHQLDNQGFAYCTFCGTRLDSTALTAAES